MHGKIAAGGLAIFSAGWLRLFGILLSMILAVGCAACGTRPSATLSESDLSSIESAVSYGPSWKGVMFSSPTTNSALRNSILNDLGVSWWYSGGYEDVFLSDSRFVPMIAGVQNGVYQGGVCAHPSCLATYGRNYPGRTWLLLDEPERAGGSNLTPAIAASHVNTIVNAIRGADSSALFFCCGTRTDNIGLYWMEEFLRHVTVTLDGIHVHAYSPGHVKTRTASLEDFYFQMQTYDETRGLPLWITEVGFPCNEGSSEWVRDSLAVPFFEWYRCGGGSGMYERVAWYTTSNSQEGWTPTHLYGENWTRLPLAYYYRLLGEIPPPPPTPAGPTKGAFLSFSPVADAAISAWYSTRNYGLDGELTVRSMDVKAALLRFDVSAIPTVRADSILHARLLFYTTRTGYGTINASLYRVLRPWSETETTWQLASQGTFWDRPGCNGIGSDRSATAESSFVLEPSGGPWYQADLTATVRDWVADPNANHGLVIKSLDRILAEFAFASKDHPDSCWRPRLEVWYDTSPLPPTPTPSATTAATETATNTPTSPATPTPSSTATETATLLATHTPTWAGTLPPTPTGAPSATGTLSPTVTRSPTGTFSPSPSPAASATPTSSATPSATSTLWAVETKVTGMEASVVALATRMARVADTFDQFNALQWPGSGSSPGTYRDIVAYRVRRAPVIDGDIGEWDTLGNRTLNVETADYRWGKSAVPDDPRMGIRARWDDERLYLMFHVRDPNIVTDSGIRYWQDDGIEVGIDGAYDRVFGGSDDHTYAMRPDGTFVDFDRAAPRIYRAVTFWTYGYDIEMAIPLSVLASAPISSGTRIGISFGLRDDDDGGDLDAYLVWEGSDPYIGRAYFGDLLFSSEEAPSVSNSAEASLQAITGSVVLQQGLNGYSGAQDTYLISGGCWDLNFVGEDSLGLGSGPNRRPLLRFDLTNTLPSQATVTRALLSLRAFSGSTSSVNVRAYQVLRPWRADEVNWSRATHETWWATAGCDEPDVDRSSRFLVEIPLSVENTWYDFDVTYAVRAWAEDPATNHGVLLVAMPDSSARFRFYSSESAQTGWRPKLTIYYNVP